MSNMIYRSVLIRRLRCAYSMSFKSVQWFVDYELTKDLKNLKNENFDPQLDNQYKYFEM